MIRGSEDCAVDVRADDAAELRHGVCEADPDACCDGAVDCGLLAFVFVFCFGKKRTNFVGERGETYGRGCVLAR